MIGYVLVAVGVVVGVEVAFGFFLVESVDNWADRGTFGDMFGALNTLFSGLAFFGVIYAIFLQKSELSLQRQELALTRRELGRAAEAQEKSEASLKDQAIHLDTTARISTINLLLESLLRQRGVLVRSVAPEDRERLKVVNQEIAKLDKVLEVAYREMYT